MNTTPKKNMFREFKLVNAEASEYRIRDNKSVPNPLAITAAISYYLMIYWVRRYSIK